MTRSIERLLAGPVASCALATALAAACVSAPGVGPASAQQPAPLSMPPASTIQPQTTISLNGRGAVDQAPDQATISLGVQVEGETAAAAMADQAKKMTAVFAAVKAAGIADRDMQTSNLSLNAVYDYPNNQRPRLRAYQASNQIAITVRDLAKLGPTLDAVVKAGGNTINGVAFGIDKPEPHQSAARIAAIKDAAAKAEEYAKAVGYRVKRIVTVSEIETYYEPPMPMMARQAMDMAQAVTPTAGGEVSLVAQVSVTFELEK